MMLIKTYQKFISLLAAVCVFSSFLTAPPSRPVYASIENLPLSLVPLGIPQELASIKEAFLPSTQTENIPLIHIQSIHAHAQTQKKIHALLKFLDEKYGIRTMFIEGAGERLDPDYFKFFDENELNIEVAQKLVEKGELTGAELFLVESQKKIPAFGIEDPNLYRDNLESFQVVMSRRNETRAFSKGIGSELDRLETHLLTPNTRKLLRMNESFEAGQMELLSYAFELERNTRLVLKTDLRNFESQKDWPQMIRLLRLQGAERDLDPERIETDRQKLIADLKDIRVNPVLINAFQNLSFSPYQTGMVYDPGFNKNDLPRYLAEYLAVSTLDKGFSFDHYPYFTHYLEAAVLQSELDAERLFNEMERLFEKLVQTVSVQPEELKLVGLAQRGGLFERLFDLELTPKDYMRMQDLPAASRPLIRFLIDIQSLHEKTNLDPAQMIPANIQAVEYLYEQAMRFYQLAKMREDVMVEKILSADNSSLRGGRDGRRSNLDEIASATSGSTPRNDHGVTVLITGGFHADGLSRAFRKKGISYAIVSPRITEKASSDDYVSSLLGEKKTSFDVAYLERAVDLISLKLLASQLPVKMREEELRYRIKSVLLSVIETGMNHKIAAVSLINKINASIFASDRGFHLKLGDDAEEAILVNEDDQPILNEGKVPIVIPVGLVVSETRVLMPHSVPMTRKKILKKFGISENVSSAVPGTSQPQTMFLSRQEPQISTSNSPFGGNPTSDFSPLTSVSQRSEARSLKALGRAAVLSTVGLLPLGEVTHAGAQPEPPAQKVPVETSEKIAGLKKAFPYIDFKDFEDFQKKQPKLADQFTEQVQKAIDHLEKINPKFLADPARQSQEGLPEFRLMSDFTNEVVFQYKMKGRQRSHSDPIAYLDIRQNPELWKKIISNIVNYYYLLPEEKTLWHRLLDFEFEKKHQALQARIRQAVNKRKFGKLEHGGEIEIDVGARIRAEYALRDYLEDFLGIKRVENPDERLRRFVRLLMTNGTVLETDFSPDDFAQTKREYLYWIVLIAGGISLLGGAAWIGRTIYKWKKSGAGKDFLPPSSPSRSEARGNLDEEFKKDILAPLMQKDPGISFFHYADIQTDEANQKEIDVHFIGSNNYAEGYVATKVGSVLYLDKNYAGALPLKALSEKYIIISVDLAGPQFKPISPTTLTMATVYQLKNVVKGKVFIDFGAGSQGYIGLLAGKLGAKEVLFVERESKLHAAIRANAKRSGIPFQIYQSTDEIPQEKIENSILAQNLGYGFGVEELATEILSRATPDILISSGGKQGDHLFVKGFLNKREWRHTVFLSKQLDFGIDETEKQRGTFATVISSKKTLGDIFGKNADATTEWKVGDEVIDTRGFFESRYRIVEIQASKITLENLNDGTLLRSISLTHFEFRYQRIPRSASGPEGPQARGEARAKFETVETVQEALKQIRETQGKFVNEVAKNNLKAGVAEVIQVVREGVEKLELKPEVHTFILGQLPPIESAKLNRAQREKVAVLLIFLSEEFPDVFNFGFRLPIALPDGVVHLVLGHHETQNDVQMMFQAIKNQLPPLPTVATAEHPTPELVFHIEYSTPRSVLTELQRIHGISSIDDTKSLIPIYREFLGRNDEGLRPDAERLERGQWPAKSPQLKSPYFGEVYRQIFDLKKKGYDVRVFFEKMSALTAYRAHRALVGADRILSAFSHGDEGKIKQILRENYDFSYQADLKRDFEEEGPAMNRRIDQYPKATHFILRGVKHSHLLDQIAVPKERRHLIWGLPDSSHPERYVPLPSVLHNLRLEKKQLSADQEEQFLLQGMLFSLMLTILQRGGKNAVESIPALNSAVSQLSADDILRVLRSFQDVSISSQRPALYEIYYRVKTNFPNILEPALIQAIEESIQAPENYGKSYIPRSTIIPSRSASLRASGSAVPEAGPEGPQARGEARAIDEESVVKDLVQIAKSKDYEARGRLEALRLNSRRLSELRGLYTELIARPESYAHLIPTNLRPKVIEILKDVLIAQPRSEARSDSADQPVLDSNGFPLGKDQVKVLKDYGVSLYLDVLGNGDDEHDRKDTFQVVDHYPALEELIPRKWRELDREYERLLKDPKRTKEQIDVLDKQFEALLPLRPTFANMAPKMWVSAIEKSRQKQDPGAERELERWRDRPIARFHSNLVRDPVTGKTGMIFADSGGGKSTLSYHLSTSQKFEILADDDDSVYVMMGQKRNPLGLGNLLPSEIASQYTKLTEDKPLHIVEDDQVHPIEFMIIIDPRRKTNSRRESTGISSKMKNIVKRSVDQSKGIDRDLLVNSFSQLPSLILGSVDLADLSFIPAWLQKLDGRSEVRLPAGEAGSEGEKLLIMIRSRNPSLAAKLEGKEHRKQLELLATGKDLKDSALRTILTSATYGRGIRLRKGELNELIVLIREFQKTGSQAKSQVSLQGPDGPIQWEVSKVVKDLIQRLDWNVLIKEGVKEISRLFDDYMIFGEKPSAFLWVLEHIYDPQANFTEKERNFLLGEIAMSFKSYPELEMSEGYVFGENQLEAWWYLLVRMLVLEHSLTQRPQQDELAQKHREFVEDIYSLTLGGFKDALERGFTKQNIKALFEPRLYQLAKSQPKLRGLIGELFKNWELLADAHQQTWYKFLEASQEKEEEPTISEGLTDDKIREVIGKVITSARRQQWVVQQLLKLRNVLTPRIEDEIEMWDHPIEYMKKAFGDVGTILLETRDETNLKYKTSTGELPNRWKFRLAWLDEMGQLGFKQWAITSSLQYIEAFPKAYGREEDRPTIQYFVELLEEYLNNPQELPLREHLGLPAKGEESPEIVGSLKFWKKVLELKNRYKAHVTLWRALELENDDDLNNPSFKSFDNWLKKTKGAKRLILGVVRETSFEKGHDRIGTHNDPDIARISQIQASEEYPYETFRYWASMAHISYQIGQARGWGDHQAASFLIRKHQALRDFFQEKNGPEDMDEAMRTGWWTTVKAFENDSRVFDMRVIVSESDEKEMEELWVPEDIEAGVAGPRSFASLRSEARAIDEESVVKDLVQIAKNKDYEARGRLEALRLNSRRLSELRGLYTELIARPESYAHLIPTNLRPKVIEILKDVLIAKSRSEARSTRPEGPRSGPSALDLSEAKRSRSPSTFARDGEQRRIRSEARAKTKDVFLTVIDRLARTQVSLDLAIQKGEYYLGDSSDDRQYVQQISDRIRNSLINGLLPLHRQLLGGDIVDAANEVQEILGKTKKLTVQSDNVRAAAEHLKEAVRILRSLHIANRQRAIKNPKPTGKEKTVFDALVKEIELGRLIVERLENNQFTTVDASDMETVRRMILERQEPKGPFTDIRVEDIHFESLPIDLSKMKNLPSLTKVARKILAKHPDFDISVTPGVDYRYTLKMSGSSTSFGSGIFDQVISITPRSEARAIDEESVVKDLVQIAKNKDYEARGRLEALRLNSRRLSELRGLYTELIARPESYAHLIPTNLRPKVIEILKSTLIAKPRSEPASPRLRSADEDASKPKDQKEGRSRSEARLPAGPSGFADEASDARNVETVNDAGVSSDTARSQSKQQLQIPEPKQISEQTFHASSFFIKGQSATIMPNTKKLTVAERKNSLSHAFGILPSTPPTTAATKNAWNSVKEVFDIASSRFKVQNISTSGFFSFHHTSAAFNRETVTNSSLKVNNYINKDETTSARSEARLPAGEAGAEAEQFWPVQKVLMRRGRVAELSAAAFSGKPMALIYLVPKVSSGKHDILEFRLQWNWGDPFVTLNPTAVRPVEIFSGQDVEGFFRIDILEDRLVIKRLIGKGPESDMMMITAPATPPRRSPLLAVLGAQYMQAIQEWKKLMGAPSENLRELRNHAKKILEIHEKMKDTARPHDLTEDPGQVQIVSLLRGMMELSSFAMILLEDVQLRRQNSTVKELMSFLDSEVREDYDLGSVILDSKERISAKMFDFLKILDRPIEIEANAFDMQHPLDRENLRFIFTHFEKVLFLYQALKEERKSLRGIRLGNLVVEMRAEKGRLSGILIRRFDSPGTNNRNIQKVTKNEIRSRSEMRTEAGDLSRIPKPFNYLQTEYKTPTAGTGQRPPEFVNLDTTQPDFQKNLEDLKNGYIAFLNVRKTGARGNLLPLLALAKKLNPQFTTRVPLTELQNAGENAHYQFQAELNHQIFFPANEMVEVHVKDDGVGLLRWHINDKTWRAEPYLGSYLWTSEGNWIEEIRAGNFALSYGRYVTMDSKNLSAQSQREYQGLVTNPNFATDSLPIPYRMRSLIDTTAMDEERYFQLIYLPMVEGEERQHARDFTFAELWYQEDLSQDLTRDAKLAEALLKPNSFIREDGIWPHDLKSFKPMDLHFIATPVKELAGQLGRLRDLMNAYLKAGRPQEAYLLFLSQMRRSNAETAQFTRMHASGDPAMLNQTGYYYKQTGNILMQSLFSTKLFQGKQLGTWTEILSEIEQGQPYETAVVRARDLIEEIYEMHFWPDQAARLKESPYRPPPPTRPNFRDLRKAIEAKNISLNLSVNAKAEIVKLFQQADEKFLLIRNNLTTHNILIMKRGFKLPFGIWEKIFGSKTKEEEVEFAGRNIILRIDIDSRGMVDDVTVLQKIKELIPKISNVIPQESRLTEQELLEYQASQKNFSAQMVDVESVYQDLFNFYQNELKKTSFLPQQLALGAKLRNLNWQGRSVDLIVGAHGAPKTAELLAEVSKNLLKDKFNSALFFEGANREETFSESAPLIDSKVAWRLYDKHKIQSFDVIPSGSESEVVEAIHGQTGLSKEQILGFIFFMDLGFFLAETARKSIPAKVAFEYFTLARIDSHDNPVDLVLKVAHEAGKSMIAQDEFAKQLNLVKDVQLHARNSLAQKRLNEFLALNPHIKHIAAVVGYRHAPVFDLPIEAPRSDPPFSGQAVYLQIRELFNGGYLPSPPASRSEVRAKRDLALSKEQMYQAFKEEGAVSFFQKTMAALGAYPLHALDESKIRDRVIRWKDKNGQPGSLVEIKDVDRLIVVGDIHEAYHNLEAILREVKIGQVLRKNKKTHIVFLGEVHPHQTVNLTNPQAYFDSSMPLLQIFRLKQHFPLQVHYLPGNHDYAHLPNELGGMSVTQKNKKGERFNENDFFEKELFGEGKPFPQEALEGFKQFIKESPVVLKIHSKGDGTRILLQHAGVAKDIQTLEDLINLFTPKIRDLTTSPFHVSDQRKMNPLLEILWSRDYSADAVRSYAGKTGVDFIVGGHTPATIRNSKTYGFYTLPIESNAYLGWQDLFFILDSTLKATYLDLKLPVQGTRGMTKFHDDIKEKFLDPKGQFAAKIAAPHIRLRSEAWSRSSAAQLLTPQGSVETSDAAARQGLNANDMIKLLERRVREFLHQEEIVHLDFLKAETEYIQGGGGAIVKNWSPKSLAFGAPNTSEKQTQLDQELKRLFLYFDPPGMNWRLYEVRENGKPTRLILDPVLERELDKRDLETLANMSSTYQKENLPENWKKILDERKLEFPPTKDTLTRWLQSGMYSDILTLTGAVEIIYAPSRVTDPYASVRAPSLHLEHFFVFGQIRKVLEPMYDPYTGSRNLRSEMRAEEKIHLLVPGIHPEKSTSDPEARQGMEDKTMMRRVRTFIRDHQDEAVRISYVEPLPLTLAQDDRDFLGTERWIHKKIDLSVEDRMGTRLKKIRPVQHMIHELNGRLAVVEAGWPETGGKPLRFRLYVIQEENKPTELKIDPVLDVVVFPRLVSLVNLSKKYSNHFKTRGTKIPTEEELKAWLRQGRFNEIQNILDAIDFGSSFYPSPHSQRDWDSQNLSADFRVVNRSMDAMHDTYRVLSRESRSEMQIENPTLMNIENLFREVDAKYLKTILELFFKHLESPAVLVPASGSDISSVLLLSNAETALMVDLLPFGETRATVSEDDVKEYFNMKKELAWHTGGFLRGVAGQLRVFVEEELKRIGASEIKIVQDSTDSNTYHVNFKWAYPGEEVKAREFIFVGNKNANAVSEDDLKKWSALLPAAKFNGVILKAAESMVLDASTGLRNPEGFIAQVLSILQPHSPIISDIPLDLPMQDVQLIEKPELLAIEKEGAQFGYGEAFHEFPQIKEAAHIYVTMGASMETNFDWTTLEPLARFDQTYKNLVEFLEKMDPKTQLAIKLLELNAKLGLEQAKEFALIRIKEAGDGKYQKENPVDLILNDDTFKDIANNILQPVDYLKMNVLDLAEASAKQIFALHFLKEQDRPTLEKLFGNIPPTETPRSETRTLIQAELPVLPLIDKMDGTIKQRPYYERGMDPQTVMRAILEVAKQIRWVFSVEDEAILPALIEVAKQTQRPETENLQFNSEIARVFTLLAKGANQPGIHATALDYVPSASELRGLLVPLMEGKKARVSIFVTPEAVKSPQDQGELAKRVDEISKLVPDGRASLVYASEWTSLRKEVLKAAHEAHQQYFPEGEIKFQTFLGHYFVLSLPENLSEKIAEFGQDFGGGLRSVTYSVPEAKRTAYLVIMSGASTKLAQDVLSLSQKQDLFEIKGSRFKIKNSAFALVEAIWKVFEATKQMAMAA